MVASRYMAGMGYNPALRTASYGALRGRSQNALAPAYGMGPGVGFAAPQGGQMPAAPQSVNALSGGASGGALLGGAMPQPPPQDSESNNAGVDTGAATGAFGAPSTGSFVSDMQAAGPIAAGVMGGLMGGPVGLATMVGGTFAAGLARAAGREDIARGIFNAAFGSPVSSGPYSDLGNPATPGGEPTGGNLGPGGPDSGGNLSDPSMSTDPNTATNALSGSMASGLMSYGPAPQPTIADILGGAQTGGLDFSGLTGDSSGMDGGMGNPGSGESSGGGLGTSGGEGSGGGLNDSPGSSSPGGDASQGAGSNASEGFRKGGYTGHGGDGQVDPYSEVGPVHEGEFVLRHEATRHYGPELLAALNSGAIPRNALMALMPQRRPMQAANHLVQMMMARG